MDVILSLVFWTIVVFSTTFLYKRLNNRSLFLPARHLNEITNVNYYRRLSPAQFESLLMQAIRAHDFVLLGDPHLGRSKEQGYLWKRGKKSVIVSRSDHAVSEADLEEIARSSRRAAAENVIVFSPFYKTPRAIPTGVEILSGKRLLRWFSVLEHVVPPAICKASEERCVCGALMEERVSRAGLPLLVCSAFPDCRITRLPVAPRTSPHDHSSPATAAKARD